MQTSFEQFVQNPRAELDVDVTHDDHTVRMQVAGELDMATRYAYSTRSEPQPRRTAPAPTPHKGSS